MWENSDCQPRRGPNSGCVSPCRISTVRLIFVIEIYTTQENFGNLVRLFPWDFGGLNGYNPENEREKGQGAVSPVDRAGWNRSF